MQWAWIGSKVSPIIKATEDIKLLVAETLKKGEALLKTQWRDNEWEHWVDLEQYHEFMGGCRLIINKLGSAGAVWAPGIPNRQNYLNAVMEALGTLRSIRDALQKGRLSNVEELVTGEILTDLLEQAEVLIEKKFYLPAAIILRSVLEERLRKLCESNSWVPAQAKPTIEHYKQALYKAGIIDKIVQKKIDWMAGVGNAAAHNLSAYQDSDVATLYKDTIDFLARFSA